MREEEKKEHPAEDQRAGLDVVWAEGRWRANASPKRAPHDIFCASAGVSVQTAS